MVVFGHCGGDHRRSMIGDPRAGHKSERMIYAVEDAVFLANELYDLGHEVIVGNVRELRAISHSDRKSYQVDSCARASGPAAHSGGILDTCQPGPAGESTGTTRL